MAEFTGERLIPGEVDVDLLNEHLARYTFAARLARGKNVLDAGCGAGYGSAELARTALTVVGVDVAAEAVEFASTHYQLSNLRFEQASCEQLPFPDAGFDLVVAFEVIEHLERWRDFLLEVHRVLAPNGQFVVSTPNKLYYTESRGVEGANPFHVHEFTFDEFQRELEAIFPHVSFFLENHVEAVTFQPHHSGQTADVRVDAGEPAPDESHFFVAVCASRPQMGNPTFVYVPRTANVLRERERHIGLLEHEVTEKNGWLAQAQADLAEYDRQYRKLEADLIASNRWAEQLNTDLQDRRARVIELQEEIAAEQENARKVVDGFNAKIAELEQDVVSKIEWTRRVEANLNAEIAKQTAELVKAVEALNRTEKELLDRTDWALRLQEQVSQLGQQVELYKASRWVKLGRKVGLGPTS